MSALPFTRTEPGFGPVTLRRLDPTADAVTVHAWVRHPKARFWGMADADLAAVTEAYRRVVGHPHRDAALGLVDGVPGFLAERYDPAVVELAGHYPARPGDVGMHLLCAGTDAPRHGFTRAAIRTVLAWLFADPGTRRVVVEPDLRNTAVHALNAAVGFRAVGPWTLPDKRALLSTCTRSQFHAALAADPGGAPRVES